MKTLAEIAIEAGLVTKANATKAGKMAEERKQPLIAMLIRELGVDEVALIGAVRKHTRVPLLDPAAIQIDNDALRIVARDACARLRVLPLQVATEGNHKFLRVAMADPTDSAAIAELEQLSHCEIEVTALPLSAIEELVDKGYRAFSTAVVSRPRSRAEKLVMKTTRLPMPIDGSSAAGESEISVTAQVPLSSLTADPDLEARFMALCDLLISKGVITDGELAEALRKVTSRPDGSSES
ncbi:MAG TPA: hypothetical protein VLX92_09370 [Kofleriaceae bacterium]|nr:hypothetical protein [Kofleriaceae bacterium]